MWSKQKKRTDCSNGTAHHCLISLTNSRRINYLLMTHYVLSPVWSPWAGNDLFTIDHSCPQHFILMVSRDSMHWNVGQYSDIAPPETCADRNESEGRSDICLWTSFGRVRGINRQRCTPLPSHCSRPTPDIKCWKEFWEWTATQLLPGIYQVLHDKVRR